MCVPAQGLEVAEWILTSIFASELVLNFVADFFWDFWKSPWNLFDAIVVLTTIATSVMDSNLNLGVLRLVRILRVVRLINFAGSLKNIITAMFSAALPVLNSFALLGLGHLVFALVGVDFFGKDNPELFGSFFVGLFTLLQCTTADNWTDIVFHISAAQNGVEVDPDNELLEPYVVVFFVLFMIINHIVLINIVIAVLLDGFLNTMSEERQTAVEMLEMQREERDSFFELLEPLTQFRSAKDLTLTVEEIYKKLDLDNSGQVSFMVCSVCLHIDIYQHMHAYIHERTLMSYTYAGIS
jgi:voltage-gated sodium channel